MASHHTGGGGEVKTQRALSILVLIASKHEWISRALETVLAPRGYVVHTAFTRADTLTQIGREPPDAVIVDDLLATGGTAAATLTLVRQLGGEIVGLDFLVELKGLQGRDKLVGYPVHSTILYP